MSFLRESRTISRQVVALERCQNDAAGESARLVEGPGEPRIAAGWKSRSGDLRIADAHGKPMNCGTPQLIDTSWAWADRSPPLLGFCAECRAQDHIHALEFCLGLV